MAGALQKAMVYLGLKEEADRYDDEYFDDDYRPADDALEAHTPAPARPERSERHEPSRVRDDEPVRLDREIARYGADTRGGVGVSVPA